MAYGPFQQFAGIVSINAIIFCFSWTFSGASDVRVSDANEEMKVAAKYVLIDTMVRAARKSGTAIL